MSRRGRNPSRAERTQRRAARRAERPDPPPPERTAMEIPDAIRALTDKAEENDGGWNWQRTADGGWYSGPERIGKDERG